jgi:N-acetylglucosaminyltransferase
MALFGLYYRWRVRHKPAEERVSALALLPLAVVMPLSYVLQTPLALFSLDSASWETRNHQAVLDAKARGADDDTQDVA